MKKICAVICHPDDELFFAGALGNYRDAGYQVRVLYLTRGGMGSVSIPESELKQERMREARRSNRILGFLTPDFLDYPDSRMLCTPELVTDIVRWLRQEQPECVLTHAADDTETDHRYGAEAVQNARVPCNCAGFDPATPPVRIRDIYYLVYEHKPIFHISRKPEIFINIESQMPRILKARTIYVTQQPEHIDARGRLKTGIDYFLLVKKAELYGNAAGCRYAEAYTATIRAGDWSQRFFPASGRPAAPRRSRR